MTEKLVHKYIQMILSGYFNFTELIYELNMTSFELFGEGIVFMYPCLSIITCKLECSLMSVDV